MKDAISIRNYKDNEEVECWSCYENIQVLAIKENDGSCPVCKAEIDLTEVPYQSFPPG